MRGELNPTLKEGDRVCISYSTSKIDYIVIDGSPEIKSQTTKK